VLVTGEEGMAAVEVVNRAYSAGKSRISNSHELQQCEKR
jgi:hypothetical protein